MAVRTIIRGDSYETGRPFYTYTFLDSDQQPFDLRGCDIMTTFKPEITPIETDSEDVTAVIKHEIQISLVGAVEYQDGLYLSGTAQEGSIQDRWTASETRSLPVGVLLYGDLQITDTNGEVYSFIFEETILAEDGVTHRDPHV